MSKESARLALLTLLEKYDKIDLDKRADETEENIVNHFITPFFRDVLGFPTDDLQRYQYERYTPVGRPDITVWAEHGEKIYIEAKRLEIIKGLDLRRFDMAASAGELPSTGIARDRTREEQQAINYAFENGGKWAILTNFQKLRIFNARRDWLIDFYETPNELVDRFEELWANLAYENILKGSLDRLSEHRPLPEYDRDYLALINDLRLTLARDILNHRGDNLWVVGENGQIKVQELRAVVQRYLDRMAVIRFAEDHLIIPTSNSLQTLYDYTKDNSFTFGLLHHIREFFRGFDIQHNSALFAPHPSDHAYFSAAVLGELIQTLYRARYRAMPADIMGNTYEQYLGTTLSFDSKGQLQAADNIETRKKQGTYYTPQVIVRYIVDSTLGRYLYGTRDGKPNGEPLEGATRQTIDSIRELRVLDSACGSGSFLIYAYEVLVGFYRSEITRMTHQMQARMAELAKQGATHMDLQMERTVYQAQLEYLKDYPRIILEKHLYGVDLDPQAAEIAAVNLIMRSMEGLQNESAKDKRLPLILNQNLKVGNSLIGMRPDDPRMAEYAPQLAELARLRQQLAQMAHGAEHDAVVEQIASLTATLNTELDTYFPPVNPFHWGVHFPEVFYDAEGYWRDNGGFSIGIGNPPWEILKPDLREFYAQFDADIESKLTRNAAENRIETLNHEDPRRAEAWAMQKARVEATSAYFSQSADYTRQGKGDRATHKLFIERMYGLLEQTGRLGYVVPSGIYTDLGTKELREMLLNEGRIDYIFSFSNERFFFKDVHHSFKFTLLGTQKGVQGDGFWGAFRFNPRVAVAPDELPDFLANEENLIYVKRESITKFSPDSLSIMEFPTRRDYAIAEKIYGEHPLLGDLVTDGWNMKLTREFDVTNDRHFFNQTKQGVPLYEGKMIHQFNAYFAPPQYWVDESRASQRLQDKNGTGQDYLYHRLAFRDIARSTDERTLISAILPTRVFCNNKVPLIRLEDRSDYRTLLFIESTLNSFVLDFLIRQKVSTSLNFFYMETLPLPRPTKGDRYFDAIVSRAAQLTCTTSEFAGLWASVMGSQWDESCGAVDAAGRQQLRAEIDGLVAHLYGLSESELVHILGTFPLVGEPVKDAVVQAYRDVARGAVFP